MQPMNWNILSIIDLVAAFIALYVAGYHFFLSSKGFKRQENLCFALSSVSVFLYTVLNALIYASPSPGWGVYWFSLQVISVNLCIISFFWFVYFYSRRMDRKIVMSFTVLFVLFCLADILLWDNGLTVSFDRPLRIDILLPDLIDFHVYQGDTGPVVQAQFFAVLLSILVGFYYLLRYFRDITGKYDRILVICIGLFFLASINDLLMALGTYGFIFLMQYAFLFVLVSMAFIMMNHFINLHFRVDGLNRNLERIVADRTRDLNESYVELQKIYRDLKAKDDMIARDLQMAQSIQSRIMMPVSEIIGLRFIIRYQPMLDVGGDIYDISQVEDGIVRIFLADALGHGIQAALITMLIKSEYELLKRECGKPSEITGRLNEVFFDWYDYLQSYFSCIIIDVNTRDRVFNYSSAGFPDQVFIDGGRVSLLESCGPIIGMKKDAEYGQGEVSCGKGSFLCLFTDGLVEQNNGRGEMFGYPRLLEILRVSRRIEPALECITASLKEFSEGREPIDDLTLIGIEL